MIILVTNQDIDIEKFNQDRSLPAIVMGTMDDCIDFIFTLDRVSLDTETTNLRPFNGKLLLLQVGNSVDQCVIDVTTVDISPLKGLLESKLILMHNAKFDWAFMYHYGINIHNIYDTMLGEAILTTGYDSKDRKLSLKHCGKKYCSVDLDKEARGLIHRLGLVERIIRYAAEDIVYLERIMDLQMNLINMYGLNNVVNLENRFVRVLSKMEYNGILIDKNKWQVVIDKVNNDIGQLVNNLDNMYLEELALATASKDDKKIKFLSSYVEGTQLDLFIDTRKIRINWSAPAQKLALLKALGINVGDVERNTLVKVKSKHAIVPLLIEYARLSKMRDSFGESFLTYINKATGRVHPSYFQIVSTGRISSKEPNVLNIPRGGDLAKIIRSSFVARPGHRIVGGDYSNFELRILAELSGEELWIDTFLRDGDLHTELCCKTFNIDESLVKTPFPLKPTDTYRDIQKKIDFGLAYGMTEFKLGAELDMEPSKAKSIIDDFFKIVPKVKAFLDSCSVGAMHHEYIRTPLPFRRIRWFPKAKLAKANDNQYMLEEVGREGKNTPIQGGNADVIKLALCDLNDYIEKNNYPATILMTVYDEIQTETIEHKAEEWLIILKDIMINAGKEVLKTVPVKVDLKIAEYWAK